MFPQEKPSDGLYFYESFFSPGLLQVTQESIKAMYTKQRMLGLNY